jgi:hypothetical protein
MALPVWPAGLPLAEFSRQPADPFIRTPMDSGLARQRRRFRVYPITQSVQFLLTQAQFAAYSDFVENDLNGWASWFMLKIRDGRGVRRARVRFVKAPAEELASAIGLWRVSGQVEKLNID